MNLLTSISHRILTFSLSFFQLHCYQVPKLHIVAILDAQGSVEEKFATVLITHEVPVDHSSTIFDITATTSS